MSLMMMQVWNQIQYRSNQVLDIVDPTLEGQYPREQALRVITIALLCTQGSSALRPAMSQVASMLTNDSEIRVQPTQPANPASSTATSKYSATSGSAQSHGSITVSSLPR
jgi:hypothetical protein